jgi:hypothetical protein
MSVITKKRRHRQFVRDPLKFQKRCQLFIAASNLMSSQPVTRGIVRPSKVSRKLLRRRGKTRLKVKTFNAYLRWAPFRKGLQLSPGI